MSTFVDDESLQFQTLL